MLPGSWSNNLRCHFTRLRCSSWWIWVLQFNLYFVFSIVELIVINRICFWASFILYIFTWSPYIRWLRFIWGLSFLISFGVWLECIISHLLSSLHEEWWPWSWWPWNVLRSFSICILNWTMCGDWHIIRISLLWLNLTWNLWTLRS